MTVICAFLLPSCTKWQFIAARNSSRPLVAQPSSQRNSHPTPGRSTRLPPAPASCGATHVPSLGQTSHSRQGAGFHRTVSKIRDTARSSVDTDAIDMGNLVVPLAAGLTVLPVPPSISSFAFTHLVVTAPNARHGASQQWCLSAHEQQAPEREERTSTHLKARSSRFWRAEAFTFFRVTMASARYPIHACTCPHLLLSL